MIQQRHDKEVQAAIARLARERMIFLLPVLWKTITHESWRFVRLGASREVEGYWQPLWVRVRGKIVWFPVGKRFWDWENNFVRLGRS